MVTRENRTAEVPMVGTRRARSESCEERGRHTPGLEWRCELGTVETEASAVWDAVRKGRPVTLLCDRCGAPLSVKLRVDLAN
jgi:hypothetical protein